MTDEELCKALRDGDHFEKVMCAKTAADRIEALVKEHDKTSKYIKWLCDYTIRLTERARRAEAALKEANDKHGSQT